jgi:UDP-glucuronate 4-epimerase
VSLRFFTVYGPRQRPDMAFTRFLRAAREGRDITVYGSGEQVSVEHLVDRMTATAGNIEHGSRLNRACARSDECVDDIRNVTGSELRVYREGVARGDVSRTSGDITSISERLRWEPRVSLQEGRRERGHAVAGRTLLRAA